jgi:hypothetical protein
MVSSTSEGNYHKHGRCLCSRNFLATAFSCTHPGTNTSASAGATSDAG